MGELMDDHALQDCRTSRDRILDADRYHAIGLLGSCKGDSRVCSRTRSRTIQIHRTIAALGRRNVVFHRSVTLARIFRWEAPSTNTADIRTGNTHLHRCFQHGLLAFTQAYARGSRAITEDADEDEYFRSGCL